MSEEEIDDAVANGKYIANIYGEGSIGYYKIYSMIDVINKLQKGLDNQSKEVARLDKSIHKLNLEKIELLKENEELKEKVKEYEIGIVKE